MSLGGTVCAVSDGGCLVAVGLVSLDPNLKHVTRVLLNGCVHPKHRGHGLGALLLNWMEAWARQRLAALPDDRPGVLRIDLPEARPEVIAFVERRGFRFRLAEDEMRRDLTRPIPEHPVPTGLNLLPWAPERGGMFYAVYTEAFRDRPGFPGWTEEVWRQALTGDHGFRPDLSSLVTDGDEAVAFAICAIDAREGQGGTEPGWIVQMGVRPAWRNRGLASVLLCEIMRRFRGEGRRWAVLRVGTNNPGAQRVYRRLGFEPLRRHIIYEKPLR